MISREEGGILFELGESNIGENNYVRAYAPTQYTILTIGSTDFPNKDFEQGEDVYVRVNKEGHCEVADNIDKETFIMRVVERTRLYDIDAYTFIVAKTKDQLVINKNIEDQYIKSYLNKNLVTEIR